MIAFDHRDGQAAVQRRDGDARAHSAAAHHPKAVEGARLGAALTVDHAHGLVIGETAALGDGCALVAFHSKMNALGSDAIGMLATAAKEARAAERTALQKENGVKEGDLIGLSSDEESSDEETCSAAAAAEQAGQ